MGKRTYTHFIKPTKEELEVEYLYNENSTISSLARLYNTTNPTVKKWMKEYNINKKTNPTTTTQKQYPISSSSNTEDIFNFCKTNFSEYIWIQIDNTILNKEKNLAIECCSNETHCETKTKSRNTQINRYKEFKNKNIKLLTIFETDDQGKIQNMLNYIMDKTIKIPARKTIVKKISPQESKKFLDQYHMNGAVGASFHYGLFFNDELLMVQTFGKSRFNKNVEYEIMRMATKANYAIIGGASKLFNKFIKDVNPNSVCTFADMRFGEGNVYKKCNFIEDGESQPNYWYFQKNKHILYSRVKFQKHKLKNLLTNFNENESEYQNMKNNDWDRIWDCGNKKYIWNNKKVSNTKI